MKNHHGGIFFPTIKLNKFYVKRYFGNLMNSDLGL